MSDSLMSTERRCYLCGNPDVHKHHIYAGTGRRDASEREGCWVYLCPPHHNMSDFGVHFDKQLDERLKRLCQKRWMARTGKSRDEFRAIFGRSYV